MAAHTHTGLARKLEQLELELARTAGEGDPETNTTFVLRPASPARLKDPL